MPRKQFENYKKAQTLRKYPSSGESETLGYALIQSTIQEQTPRPLPKFSIIAAWTSSGEPVDRYPAHYHFTTLLQRRERARGL